MKEKQSRYIAHLGYVYYRFALIRAIYSRGLRIFETIISIDNPFNTLTIPSSKDVDDGMEFLAGKQISEINKIAEKATAIAHSDGGVPVIKISIPHISTYYLGALLYFFEYSCALSGYCFQINPLISLV